jgi:hypothetical protein
VHDGCQIVTSYLPHVPQELFSGARSIKDVALARGHAEVLGLSPGRGGIYPLP